MTTVNSYFCGAGLMDIGLLEAGIKINQAFELDADACKNPLHNPRTLTYNPLQAKAQTSGRGWVRQYVPGLYHRYAGDLRATPAKSVCQPGETGTHNNDRRNP